MLTVRNGWVPKSLSDEQMATRASVCSALLKRFMSKDDFLLRLLTVDGTWVHNYEPENTAQSRQSVGFGSQRPKKFKTSTTCWQDDDHSILGRKRRYYVGRYTQEKYNNWSVQCKLARPAENRQTAIREKVFCCNRTTRESTILSCNGCCRAKRK